MIEKYETTCIVLIVNAYDKYLKKKKIEVFSIIYVGKMDSVSIFELINSSNTCKWNYFSIMVNEKLIKFEVYQVKRSIIMSSLYYILIYYIELIYYNIIKYNEKMQSFNNRYNLSLIVLNFHELMCSFMKSSNYFMNCYDLYWIDLTFH